jgi:succinate dehydrogenase / fumarate reductase membrane anchor subunit
MSLRSPMGRVLGLGSAKEGASHWWAQRVSAVGLVILTLWFVISLLSFQTLDHESMLMWMGKPVNAVLLLLLVITLVYHSQLGVQVVVEDYVVQHGLKIATLLVINFIHIALAASGLFAVLRVAFGNAA